MKKIILVAAFFMLAANGCKTRKASNISRDVTKIATVDSMHARKTELVKDSASLSVHVNNRDEVKEEYEETNITIVAPDKKVVTVPKALHYDTTSSLDKIKYTDGNRPATTLTIAKDSEDNKAVATLVTPTGTQVFGNWKSITISTKKYSRTGLKLSDSISNSLLHKLIKNSSDTSAKHLDSTIKSMDRQIIQKESKMQPMSLFAAFWWIPATLIIILLVIWKGNWMVLKIKDLFTK